MANHLLMEAKGHNGQLELTETVVRIRRSGFLGFLSQGLKGDKEILISQISSIQYKEAGLIVNGYIQFAFVGGHEAKGGAFQATADENTVMFTKGQQPAFDKFKQLLNEKMTAARSSPPPARSGLEDLEKLAELRDRGILSDEEFQLKKRQILGI